MNITTAPAHRYPQLGEADSRGAPVDLRGVVVVGVEGDIDIYTGPDLRRTLVDLLSPQLSTHSGSGTGGTGGVVTGSAPAPQDEGSLVPVRAVVVDLTDVEFMDSYAVGVLVQGHHLARRGGAAYAVVATHPMIHTLFKITGLGKVMPLHPDVASAVAGLRPSVQSPPA